MERDSEVGERLPQERHKRVSISTEVWRVRQQIFTPHRTAALFSTYACVRVINRLHTSSNELIVAMAPKCNYFTNKSDLWATNCFRKMLACEDLL